ncbi:ankyrin repeat domain-containing protein [Sphingomonas paeninsulae]|uniref:Ankyrin repeat domain-containing protein n=1 Tax=Sphingomonas paeninsulae TaxID=2319844 RepID=A0A494TK62_SPHPE|nr:ankyrin repeat domain-containing protein [Sphingomonas paeninsulae]AYJ87443.1 ankyrin repeat domain-containing protein [Sphingomonas paeninsulae]
MTDAALPPLPSGERIQELLFEAARRGRDDMIDALVQAGGDIEGFNSQGHTPLILASYNGNASTTAILIDKGASVDTPDLGRGNTALMGCVFKGYDEIAALLINAGADVNKRNAADQTAIMLAAMFARDAIVDLLLGAGANPALVDAVGNSAASVAAAQNNFIMANRLAS